MNEGRRSEESHAAHDERHPEAQARRRHGPAQWAQDLSHRHGRLDRRHLALHLARVSLAPRDHEGERRGRPHEPEADPDREQLEEGARDGHPEEPEPLAELDQDVVALRVGGGQPPPRRPGEHGEERRHADDPPRQAECRRGIGRADLAFPIIGKADPL